MSNRINWKATILLILGTIFILFPIYLTVIIAFKTPQEMSGNILALPESWGFGNFTEAIEVTNFFNALGNSVFVTVLTVIIVILTHSLVAYAIARNMHKKFYKFLYFYFISAMFIPFPIIMLPLVLQTSSWGMDNLVGLGILNGVMHLAFNVFIYVGYVKTLPVELEEAAIIDGANTFQVFWKIIFPMMKPMHATVAILTALAAWNDFMLPLVILSDSSMYTLPLVQYAFQGQFSTDYNLAFASYLLAMLPMVVLYIFVQKWIIGGVMRGSLK
ncbi:carbohydrate ABC transporter permease [Jeotgalibacillus terrae]|uniref:Carbohydrate ABC transporter permease n=1 Tax=Jeotgalibacillus terrae TaxID=587735 RepID=A0ABW5ZBQ5_9BACL|nr:carbohydrate ABC transporter permease [Jeotgalibacillus terrae]MBM7577871.1 raffinose/stachyose/melibiose transport system permease protein [Jeotgalibacillus terrae]